MLPMTELKQIREELAAIKTLITELLAVQRAMLGNENTGH